MASHLCDIEHALGRTTPCPGEPCPFWEHDGCVVAGLRSDLDTKPELAQFLFALRGQLDREFTPSNAPLLPPGLRE